MNKRKFPIKFTSIILIISGIFLIISHLLPKPILIIGSIIVGLLLIISFSKLISYSYRTLFLNLTQINFLQYLLISTILFFYITLIFALIYTIPLDKCPGLCEGDITVNNGESFTLLKSFYFSGVTIFSLGYGDITPNGIFELVSIIEVFLGVVLLITLFSIGTNVVIKNWDNKKWTKIKEKAIRLYESKLNNLGTDLLRVFNIHTVNLPTNTSQENYSSAIDEAYRLKFIEFSQLTINNLKEKIDMNELNDFDKGLIGGLEEYFESFERDLDKLEQKYGSHFSPDELNTLIDLQTHLEGLSVAFKLKDDFGEDYYKTSIAKYGLEIFKIIVKTLSK